MPPTPTTTATLPPPPPRDQIVSARRLARSLGIATKTLIKMSERGDFPAAIDIGVRKKLYRLSDVQAWWRERLGGLNGAPFPLAPEEPEDRGERRRR